MWMYMPIALSYTSSNFKNRMYSKMKIILDQFINILTVKYIKLMINFEKLSNGVFIMKHCNM